MIMFVILARRLRNRLAPAAAVLLLRRRPANALSGPAFVNYAALLSAAVGECQAIATGLHRPHLRTPR